VNVTGANAALALTFAQALWLVLPVLLAGLIHVAVIRLNLLPVLARWPLDGHLTFRGRRLLGRNKTVRGALVMLVTSALMTVLLAQVFAGTQAHLSVAALQMDYPWAWGLLLGTGYCIGEFPNSFLKRQLGIAPGAIASGLRGAFFWVTDQLDSVAGVLLALSMAWRLDASVVACVVALALLLHPLVAALMVMLRLKDRIG